MNRHASHHTCQVACDKMCEGVVSFQYQQMNQSGNNYNNHHTEIAIPTLGFMHQCMAGYLACNDGELGRFDTMNINATHN